MWFKNKSSFNYSHCQLTLNWVDDRLVLKADQQILHSHVFHIQFGLTGGSMNIPNLMPIQPLILKIYFEDIFGNPNYFSGNNEDVGKARNVLVCASRQSSIIVFSILTFESNATNT